LAFSPIFGVVLFGDSEPLKIPLPGEGRG